MDKKDGPAELKPVEIKDLNKTQLILLAILLSFITSIATGIVTVSLIQQAPTTVTQPINRVVQQTIEKVVPDYEPEKTQTVVVKEDDLVVGAVTKTRANFGQLLASKDSTQSLADVYSVGNGNFLAANATINPAIPYTIKEGNTLFDAKVSGTSPLGFSLFIVTAVDPATLKGLPQASFASDSDVEAGQTAVLVSATAVGKGLIQSIDKEGDDSGASWNVIVTDPEPTLDMIGSIAVNLDGDVIGIVVPKGDGTTSIIASDAISKFVAGPAASIAPATPAPTPTAAS